MGLELIDLWANIWYLTLGEARRRVASVCTCRATLGVLSSAGAPLHQRAWG